MGTNLSPFSLWFIFVRRKLLILRDGIPPFPRRLIYLLTICINSRTSNFHLFKSRDSLRILLNVVPPSFYSKEAIFQSDSRLNTAQGGEKKKEKTQALSLLATKALREPVFVFFFF